MKLTKSQAYCVPLIGALIGLGLLCVTYRAWIPGALLLCPGLNLLRYNLTAIWRQN